MVNKHLDDCSIPIPAGEYLSIAGAAKAYGTTPEVIRQWSYLSRAALRPNGRLPYPEPDIEIAGSPLWEVSTLRSWSRISRVKLIGEELPDAPAKPKPRADPLLDAKLDLARQRKERIMAEMSAKRAAVRADRALP